MGIPSGKATNWIAGITVLAFLIQFLGGWIDIAALMGGFIPERFIGDTVDLAATDSGIDLLPAWITPLSATLIHANFFHLGMNLLLLMFCGRFVEHVIGPKLLVLLYLVGAYIACATEFAFSYGSVQPMVGASGAISALFGTYALLYSRREVQAFGPLSANMVRMLWTAAGWIVVNLMMALVPVEGIGRIAIGAHIGGFVAGLLLTRPLLHLRFGRLSAANKA